MNETKPIRILIADDHSVVREGLKALISIKPDMEVVGEAVDGVEVAEKASTLQPDVILLDLVMPRKDGLAAITDIKQENPNARILVLTSFADDDKVWSAIKGGALGYLLKDSSPVQLMQAIRDVHRGESSLHPTIARKLIGEFKQDSSSTPIRPHPLTKREEQVLKFVARGLSNEEISERLSVSKRTVGKHVSNILTKLHLVNRTQAALYALRKGLVTLDQPD
ncbi:MAG: response regulator [Ardenticatenaceae bacterium]